MRINRLLARLRRQDDGVTLMELLIAIIVSVMIMLALTTSFVLLFQTNDIANHVEADSRSAQQIETLLPADFQSAFPGGVDTSSGATPGCSGSIAGTNVVTLTWSQTASSTVNFAASYRLVTVTTGTTTDVMLTRFTCSGATLSSATADELVLARELATTGTPATATFTAPDTLTLSITSLNGNTYTFTAAKRTGNGSTPTTPPTPPSSASPPAESPAIVEADLLDQNHDGFPDAIKVNLTGSASGTCTTGWALSGLSNQTGSAGSTATVSGSTVTIPITPKANGTPNTSSTGLSLSFVTPSGCSILSASGLPVVDQAAPVIIAVNTIAGGNHGFTSGKMEATDALDFTFSEPVTTSATTITVTESRSATDVTTLAIPGVISPAASIDKSYLSGSNKSTAFAAVVSGSGTKDLLVTLGACTSGCGNLANSGGNAGAVTFTPAATITDSASTPNAAAGSFATATNFKAF